MPNSGCTTESCRLIAAGPAMTIKLTADNIVGLATLAGWRSSADGCLLRPVSLLTGNITGNFQKSSLRTPQRLQNCAARARFLSQFPAEPNRELFSRNREFLKLEQRSLQALGPAVSRARLHLRLADVHPRAKLSRISAARRSSSRLRGAGHSAGLMPNTMASLVSSNLELLGRFAGVGYSDVEIGTTSSTLR